MRKKKKSKKHRQNLTEKATGAIVVLYRRMYKKLALGLVWFLITPPLILTLGFYLVSKRTTVYSSTLPATNQQIHASTADENKIEGQVMPAKVASDVRPILVSNFLKGTPLAAYSKYMVQVADKYQIDYRLIPAIAMKESGGGAAINQATHNAWGFENGSTRFDTWETAIDTVGKTLKKRYIDKGLVTPDQIMAVYAPPALESGGQWAKDVNYFFSQMESL